eukprot:12087170-Prorocentrum_lima.AAC.1
MKGIAKGSLGVRPDIDVEMEPHIDEDGDVIENMDYHEALHASKERFTIDSPITEQVKTASTENNSAM